MNKSSTLYWSHLKMYEECPQQFLWRKGWDQIDLGYGPGNPRPNPSQEPKHHAVMGTAIQYAIERMYNDELYRDPMNLRRVMLEIGESEFCRQESKSRNRMDYDKIHNLTRSEMLQTVREGISGYLTTMKAHRFLGPYAKSEIDIRGWIDKWNPIAGRVDMLIRRDDSGITILDGKNTKHKMKYTDPDQLLWYALLFKLAYRKMPDRLGFVWFRFPHGMVSQDDQGNEVTESGVEWVEFKEEDLRLVAQRALDAKKGMWKEKFAATPKPKICRFCDYESICKERQKQRAANAAKRGPRRSKNLDVITNSDGFSDFSL